MRHRGTIAILCVLAPCAGHADATPPDASLASRATPRLDGALRFRLEPSSRLFAHPLLRAPDLVVPETARQPAFAARSLAVTQTRFIRGTAGAIEPMRFRPDFVPRIPGTPQTRGAAMDASQWQIGIAPLDAQPFVFETFQQRMRRLSNSDGGGGIDLELTYGGCRSR
jgi:hypothetical protein